jgi:diguanylate cyclase (GGDEF)-like protein
MDLALLALVTQWIGTLLTLSLLTFLSQSVRRPLLRYWALAWLSLTISLCSLTVAFRGTALKSLYEAIYFFGEYLFALLLIAGCRNFISGARPDRRSYPWLVGGVVVAGALAVCSPDFNVQFIPHAAIMGIAFLVAFRVLRPARVGRLGGGVSVMSFALLLLAADFLHYIPVFWIAAVKGPAHRFAYLNYTSVVDMVLEVLLGFGMVMLILDTLRREAESANVDLGHALARLEVMARTDGLTNALNRHAYHALLTESPDRVSSREGCIVLADVDRLKEINDSFGHAVGDVAIRSVATAIRSLIRADDLLFRWGGDEFLIILWNMKEEEVRSRLVRLDELLAGADLPSRPLPLTVSLGFASFGADVPMEKSIELADSLMYARKRRVKGPKAEG